MCEIGCGSILTQGCVKVFMVSLQVTIHSIVLDCYGIRMGVFPSAIRYEFFWLKSFVTTSRNPSSLLQSQMMFLLCPSEYRQRA